MADEFVEATTAAVSTAVSKISTYPLDIVKTRLATGGEGATAKSVVADLTAERGVAGLVLIDADCAGCSIASVLQPLRAAAFAPSSPAELTAASSTCSPRSLALLPRTPPPTTPDHATVTSC